MKVYLSQRRQIGTSDARQGRQDVKHQRGMFANTASAKLINCQVNVYIAESGQKHYGADLNNDTLYSPDSKY